MSMAVPFSFDDHAPALPPGDAGGYYRPNLFIDSAPPAQQPIDAVPTRPEAPAHSMDLYAMARAYGIRIEILQHLAKSAEGLDSLERMWDQMNEFNRPKPTAPDTRDPLFGHIKSTVDADILRRINAQDARRARRPRTSSEMTTIFMIFATLGLMVCALAVGFLEGEKIAARSAFQAGYDQAQQERATDQASR